MPSGSDPAYRSSRALIIVIVLCFIAIIAAGVLFYQSQEVQIKDRVITDLSSIALLKSNQIAMWRGERLGDARVISSGSFFIEGADHYLTNGDDESREKILSRFREMNESYHYDNVLLVDPQGNVRISLNPSVTSIPPSIIDQVNTSFQRGDAVMTDFYLMPGSRSARMEVIAPLIMKRDGVLEPVGAVLLSINPNAVLYPLIRSWPVPSGSAETLLVERKGDDVLFLNNLRNQDNTALNLTIPLSRADVPAVMAVQGITGAFEGKDYRDVDVISVLEPIAGSPWLMVAKVDTREAYSSWQSQAFLIIVLVAGIFVGAIIIIGLVWQRRQKYYYRSLYSAETERREEEQRNRERSETLLHLAEMESATEQELADYVLGAGCRLTNSPLAFIGMMSADESVFSITVWSKSAMKDCSVAVSPIHFSIAKAGIWAEAVRQRKPFIVNDYPAPQPGKKGLPPGHVPITRFVSVPVFAGQRIVMVCVVANSEIDYTDQDVKNLILLMQGVWSHLQKRLANEALRQKNTDLEAAYEEITASEEELAANYDELVKSQKALAESEERFRVIFERTTAGKLLISPEGNLLRINPAFAGMLGYTMGEMKESDIIKITYPDDIFESRECIRVLLAGEAPSYRMEKRFVHKTGRIVWTDVSTSLVKDNAGKPLYFINSILDISERKLTERQREMLIKELEQKNNELERFTYTVSHDLKSPLITIRGFAGLLEDDALKGDQLQLKKDIHRILEAAGTMQALLADLLELSRIGRVVNPPEKISFTRITHEAVDDLAVPLAKRGVAVEIAPDLPDVIVDHARIREVLVNLVENSIKFLGNQPDPVIRIGVENTGEGSVFFVQDNGIGINPRYLERIFNLFEKLGPSAPGTGIGLAIVRRIIEVHGGKVWVESEGPGMGTKVCFTLPVAPLPGEDT